MASCESVERPSISCQARRASASPPGQGRMRRSCESPWPRPGRLHAVVSQPDNVISCFQPTLEKGDGPAPGIRRVGLRVGRGPRRVEDMLRARVQVHLDVPAMGAHPFVEAMREGDRDDAVGFPVKDQDGRKLGNLILGGIRVAPPTVEVYDGADWRCRGEIAQSLHESTGLSVHVSDRRR